MDIEDISWPERGDELFKAGDDRWGDAWVRNYDRSFWTFASNYKDAADLLVQLSVDDRYSRDTLIYPTVFLYRHHIELVLKEMIRLGRILYDVFDGEDYYHHNLKRLWSECRKYIEETWPDGESTDVDTVENNIMQFADLDPGSFSFRYPIDKEGRQLLPSDKFIDIKNLKEVMDKISNYLDGCLAGMDEYLSIKQSL